MEHILYKAILIYLEKYNILTDCQHGFRQGRSYETQLVTTLEDIALNSNGHAYNYDVVLANAFSQSYSTMGLEETYFSGSPLG